MVRSEMSAVALDLGTEPHGIWVATTAMTGATRIGQIMESFEDSWKTPGSTVDIRGLPTIDEFLEAMEDLCGDLDLKRVHAHVEGG